MRTIRVNRTDVQSLGFDKSVWTSARAKRWLKDHGFIHGRMDPGYERAKYYWFRQFDPKKSRRYRSIPFGRSGAGIMSRIEFRGAAPRRKASLRRRTVRTNAHARPMRTLPRGIRPFRRTLRRNPPLFSTFGSSPRRPALRRGIRPSYGMHEMTGKYYRPQVRENPYGRFESRPYGIRRSSFRRNPGPYLGTRSRWQRRRGMERRMEDWR